MSPSATEYFELWTDWPLLQLPLPLLLLAALAMLVDRLWTDAVKALWRLGFDVGRRLSYSVPLLRILLLIAVPLWVLNELRVANPLAAVAMAALTIGAFSVLALDHLRDMAGGVALAITRPFKVGDTIATGAVRGSVEHIALTRCVLRAPGGELIRVPNRQLADRTLHVARRGAALPTDIEVELPRDLDTVAALAALRDQTYLSVYTDTSAPVVVEVLSGRRARIRATPIRSEEAPALASDLIARAEALLSR